MKHGAKERFCHRLMNDQSLIQMAMILFSATSSSVEKKTKKACAFCNYNGKLVGCHRTVCKLQNSRFFLEISKEIGKAWPKSLARAKRASFTRPWGV